MLKKIIKILSISVLGALILIYFFGVRPMQETLKENAKAAEMYRQEAQKYIAKITYEKYKQINSGMSYQQVCSIIGFSGKECARSSMAGISGVMDSVETVMFEWHNSDGSNMNAIFQNDQLTQKAQSGLN